MRGGESDWGGGSGSKLRAVCAGLGVHRATGMVAYNARGAAKQQNRVGQRSRVRVEIVYTIAKVLEKQVQEQLFRISLHLQLSAKWQQQQGTR